eukprot:685735-Amphidinium_carterae.1
MLCKTALCEDNTPTASLVRRRLSTKPTPLTPLLHKVFCEDKALHKKTPFTNQSPDVQRSLLQEEASHA